MAFHDIRFPADISFGSLGGPERLTEIVQTYSGHEERTTSWMHARRRYDAGMGLRHHDDLSVLIAFFEGRMGRLHAFRWKDWADFKSAQPSQPITDADQFLGLGDGNQTVFPLVKRYLSGLQTYVRPITKPVPGSVLVALGYDRKTEGTDYTINHLTGEITFVDAPLTGAQVTAGYEFDVPVRFETDYLKVSLQTFAAGEIPDVPLIEVRE